MHPAVKILAGAFLVVVGIFTTTTFLEELVVVLQGGLGPLLILVGAFIVWLESDEWKMEREEESSGNIQQQFQPQNQQQTETESPVQPETTEEESERHACQKHE